MNNTGSKWAVHFPGTILSVLANELLVVKSQKSDTSIAYPAESDTSITYFSCRGGNWTLDSVQTIYQFSKDKKKTKIYGTAIRFGELYQLQADSQNDSILIEEQTDP
jgi:hypothetical protein